MWDIYAARFVFFIRQPASGVVLAFVGLSGSLCPRRRALPTRAELLAEGDTARAQIEFRNVFEYNSTHRDARAAFAQMLRDVGRDRQAIRQYLRLVEQYPQDAEGLIALTELTLVSGDYELARRHGVRAMEIAPDDPRVAVIALHMTYIDAIEAEDPLALEAAVAALETAIAAAPDNELLQRLSLDASLRARDFDTALVSLDQLIETAPGDRRLYDTRLSILAQMDRGDEVEAQLLEMLELFPGDEELPATVLRFYLAQGDPEQAIDFLRTRAETVDTQEARTDIRTALVQLILQANGAEAALAELDAILATDDDDAAVFATHRAAIRFDLGEQDRAIADLETLLQGDDLPITQEGRIRVALARMLLATANEVGARAQVEQVLEDDPTQTDALRMQAAWLIDEDQADTAISALRTVLDLSPDDAQAMTLMSQAHGRNGNHELAREFLALAVEASDSAPAETLRYVEVLLESERFLPAEELLIASLRRTPDHLGLLNGLGRLYIEMGDWPRAEQVEASLREMGNPEPDRLANDLQVARMAAQGQIDMALTTLEELAATDNADARAQIAVIQARIATGDGIGALSYARDLVAENPDDLGFRFTLAAVLVAVGDYAEAETLYRGLLEDHPEEVQIWLGLLRVLNLQGRTDEARAALERALASSPDALDLLWAQASSLEQLGDYQGAIAIYEDMYARAPNAVIVANNLASLLSAHRSDEESLARAWTIARRLRGSDVPAFQDTYGWIAHQRGEYEEAVEHLEPAARGLPNDPMVQAHLGLTYLALARPEEALEQLRRAVNLAGPEDQRAQIVTAREEIERLEAAASD